MEIKTEHKGGVLVALVENRIDGSNALKFHDALQLVVKEADIGLVLDMERVSYISSAGLRVMLMTAKTLGNRSVRFAVCSPSEAIQKVLRISGFDKTVEMHSTRSEAISALSTR